METITAETFREEGKRVKDLILLIAQDEKLSVILEDIPYVKKVRANSRREGQLEGELKAKQIAIKNIRQTLTIRFSTPLGQYDSQLQPLELPILEQLNELVFSVTTLADFETALNQFTSA